MIDRHLLAANSLAGVVLDFMGGLYLAYDLLGGKHGPLRALTRTTTVRRSHTAGACDTMERAPGLRSLQDIRARGFPEGDAAPDG